jgi:hypothetical protein
MANDGDDDADPRVPYIAAVDSTSSFRCYIPHLSIPVQLSRRSLCHGVPSNRASFFNPIAETWHLVTPSSPLLTHRHSPVTLSPAETCRHCAPTSATRHTPQPSTPRPPPHRPSELLSKHCSGKRPERWTKTKTTDHLLAMPLQPGYTRHPHRPRSDRSHPKESPKQHPLLPTNITLCSSPSAIRKGFFTSCASY